MKIKWWIDFDRRKRCSRTRKRWNAAPLKSLEMRLQAQYWGARYWTKMRKRTVRTNQQYRWCDSEYREGSRRVEWRSRPKGARQCCRPQGSKQSRPMAQIRRTIYRAPHCQDFQEGCCWRASKRRAFSSRPQRSWKGWLCNRPILRAKNLRWSSSQSSIPMPIITFKTHVQHKR